MKQHIANQFWEANFSELVDISLDEQQALDINFWDKLQTALEATERDIVHAVIYSKPVMKLSSGEMYIRIVKTAKRVWDKKST